MDRIPELGVELEAKREEAKAILAAAHARSDGALTAAERKDLAALTERIHAVESTLRAEQEQLAWDRGSAVAVDRPADERGGTDEDERPALALPPVPARAKRKLAALAGGASTTFDEQREHFGAVIRAAMGGDPFHPALVPLAATSTESIGSEGGFAVRPDVSTDIWQRAAEESVWIRVGARVEPMTSDERTVVALDDDDETGDAEAGLGAGWTGEAQEATAEIMKLRAIVLHAKKLMVLAATSNELAEDGPAYIDALEGALGRTIGKKFDRALGRIREEVVPLDR